MVVDNVIPESIFSAKMFDDLNSDKLLMNLDIVHSEERISDTNFPKIVAFKRKNGQKGVMKRAMRIVSHIRQRLLRRLPSDQNIKIING